MASLIISRLDAEAFLVLDTDARMPEQGVEAGGSLRVVRTWYPGSSTPSVQVMGTQEDDIVIRGMWRDDMIGLAGGAFALMQNARALLLGQSPCQLQWMGTDGTALKTCTGFVKQFTPKFNRADAIGWTLTFQVDQSDESTVLAVPQVHLKSPFNLLDLLRAIAAAAAKVAEAAVLANNVIRAVV